MAELTAVVVTAGRTGVDVVVVLGGSLRSPVVSTPAMSGSSSLWWW